MIFIGYKWDNFDEEVEIGEFEITESKKYIFIKSLQEITFGYACHTWKKDEIRRIAINNTGSHYLKENNKDYKIVYFYRVGIPSWFKLKTETHNPPLELL